MQGKPIAFEQCGSGPGLWKDVSFMEGVSMAVVIGVSTEHRCSAAVHCLKIATVYSVQPQNVMVEHPVFLKNHMTHSRKVQTRYHP